MIRFDRLETLATFLDTLQKEKFDFAGYWCGTAGCALGWCPTVFPEHWKITQEDEPKLLALLEGNPFEGSMEFFAINHESSTHLFMPGSQFPKLYGGKKLYGDASPSDVAHNIREFIRVMKPKREKIKVQISPDLIEPPIPKETEKIDRPDEVIELEEKKSDLFTMLGDSLNPAKMDETLKNFFDGLKDSIKPDPNLKK